MRRIPLNNDNITRRNFLKVSIAGLAFIAAGNFVSAARTVFAEASSSNGRPKKNIKGKHDLVCAKGEDPYGMTARAVEAMGGMERFVKKNGVVVIKPNIGWDRTPEQAANTNPLVVAALIDLCFKAGARRVNIFDVPCSDARRSYENSGIQKAAKEKGANIYFPDDWDTVKAKFKYASPMEGWPVLRDAIECDTFINVPILKHHGLTKLTLSMKNLMGVCTGNRGLIHQNIAVKIVDLTDFINPDLTVIDAFRYLYRNGPTGGNVNDVKRLDSLIVATDPTLADAYAARLAGFDPLSIENIKVAVRRNFGSADLDKADIEVLGPRLA
ncbi:MAG: DUF362 domain-containing protein [Candidatus Omnitrophica bacterium]|nr:DUF362 domain-containing protein [Candidatus Omnitrophota bacterium]